MAFDGIIVSAAAKELSGLLSGGRIDKIYQPESDELIIHIHSRGVNYKLYATSRGSSAAFHLLTESIENPKAPSAFCMLLRKHLSGGRVAGIRQPDSERILEISVDTTGDLGFPESRTLIFEIMGKHSNIILVDVASKKIIDSIKRVSFAESRLRQVLPGKLYEYPPAQGKIPLSLVTEKDIESICGCPPGALSKNLLQNIQGISPAMADLLANAWTPGDIRSESIFAELESMRQKLAAGAYTPSVYLDDGGTPVDFHIFPIPGLFDSCEKLEFETLSRCVEYYYFNKAGATRKRQQAADLEKTVKISLDKLYLKKKRLAEDILAAEKADFYRLCGELLTANIHLIEKGAREANLTNYYDGENITIPLDERVSPAKNAQAYFKKYSKARTAIKEKTARLEENESDIKYLESVYSFIEGAESSEEIESLRNELSNEGYLRRRKNQPKQAKAKPAPVSYISPGGFKIMAGKNNTENDALTFKIAAGTDIWLHTKDIPGSHVILFTGGASPAAADILYAASIAAFHSKAKNSENVPVDYTFVKHVKKPTGARPGMVIFTNNKTVYVNPKSPEGQNQ